MPNERLISADSHGTRPRTLDPVRSGEAPRPAPRVESTRRRFWIVDSQISARSASTLGGGSRKSFAPRGYLQGHAPGSYDPEAASPT